MTPAPPPPARPAPPRGRIAAVALALVVLVAVACFAFVLRRAPVPVIATTGLEPAVAELIERSLRAVRETRDAASAWGNLGSVLLHFEFIEQAGAAFTQAERLEPRNPRWPYLHALLDWTHDAPAVRARLERAVALAPAEVEAPRLRLAQWLFERGHTAEAEAQLDALLRRNPACAPASLGLARLRHQQGRGSESTNHLVPCLNDPRTARSAHELLAAVQQASGDSLAASATTRRSARLPADVPWADPWWNEALAFRVSKKARLEDASVLLDQGRPAAALTLAAGIARDYPEDEEAWYLMGWALNQQQQFTEAARAIEEHLRRAPTSPRGRAQLAVALLGQRRYLEAIPVLEAALQIKPTWRELHSNLGFACVQLGRDEEAITHYRRALECDPNHRPSHTALAELLRRQRANSPKRSTP